MVPRAPRFIIKMTPDYPAQQAFSAEHLDLNRQHKEVLRNVTLSLQAGEMLSLLGANGAGKSTFLSVLAGELSAKRPHPNANMNDKNSTCITVNGKALATMAEMQQARVRSIL